MQLGLRFAAAKLPGLRTDRGSKNVVEPSGDLGGQRSRSWPLEVSYRQPVFFPRLATVLLLYEQKKGSPLTEEELLAIVDTAPAILMKRTDAAQLWGGEGDIDPENAWSDWQAYR